MKYRDVEILEDNIGAFTLGGQPKMIKRFIAKIGHLTLRGTLDEVKQKIDEELGPDEQELH